MYPAHTAPHNGSVGITGARLTIILLSALFLSVTPVIAQDIQPPTNSTNSLVRDFGELIASNGALNVVLVLIVVLVVLVAWRGLSPLLDMLKSFKTNNDNLQDELVKRLENGDRDRKQTAEALERAAATSERTAQILADIETKSEAQKSRNSAVDIINKHTDGEHEKTRGELVAIRQEFTSLRTEFGDLKPILSRLEKQIGDGAGGETKPLLETLAQLLPRMERLLDWLDKLEKEKELKDETEIPATPALAVDSILVATVAVSAGSDDGTHPATADSGSTADR